MASFLSILIMTSFLACGDSNIVSTDSDRLIFDELKVIFDDPEYKALPLNMKVLAIGEAFMDRPYVSHTLEKEGEEKLIVNLREVDCVTYVEYVTACVLAGEEDGADFETMAAHLMRLRYRGGVLNDYSSRLHYFSDWMKDKERMGFITLISDSIGDAPMDPAVYFISSHPNLYPRLRENPALISKFAKLEKEMADYNMRYISGDSIDSKGDMIKDGDLIAFVSDIKGLDISHCGFAAFREGRLCLLHASTRSNRVEYTPLPLSEYIKGLKSVSGIMVGRIKER